MMNTALHIAIYAAGALAAWIIIDTAREAVPAIKKLIEELNQ